MLFQSNILLKRKKKREKKKKRGGLSVHGEILAYLETAGEEGHPVTEKYYFNKWPMQIQKRGH